jgi:hypothetical protein
MFTLDSFIAKHYIHCTFSQGVMPSSNAEGDLADEEVESAFVVHISSTVLDLLVVLYTSLL